MHIDIVKHTGLPEARRAIETTCYEPMQSTATLAQIYQWLHSPIRTQMFEIFVFDAPTFVATHMVRHVTTQPFVSTQRVDRGSKKEATRSTPVNMIIWANAEAILSMAGKRLCYKSSLETRHLMKLIKKEMQYIDADLAKHMQPQCVYQGGYCREPKPCGQYQVKRYDPEVILENITF